MLEEEKRLMCLSLKGTETSGLGHNGGGGIIGVLEPPNPVQSYDSMAALKEAQKKSSGSLHGRRKLRIGRSQCDGDGETIFQ